MEKQPPQKGPEAMDYEETVKQPGATAEKESTTEEVGKKPQPATSTSELQSDYQPSTPPRPQEKPTAAVAEISTPNPMGVAHDPARRRSSITDKFKKVFSPPKKESSPRKESSPKKLESLFSRRKQSLSPEKPVQPQAAGTASSLMQDEQDKLKKSIEKPSLGSKIKKSFTNILKKTGTHPSDANLLVVDQDDPQEGISVVAEKKAEEPEPLTSATHETPKISQWTEDRVSLTSRPSESTTLTSDLTSDVASEKSVFARDDSSSQEAAAVGSLVSLPLSGSPTQREFELLKSPKRKVLDQSDLPESEKNKGPRKKPNVDDESDREKDS